MIQFYASSGSAAIGYIRGNLVKPNTPLNRTKNVNKCIFSRSKSEITHLSRSND